MWSKRKSRAVLTEVGTTTLKRILTLSSEVEYVCLSTSNYTRRDVFYISAQKDTQ